MPQTEKRKRPPTIPVDEYQLYFEAMMSGQIPEVDAARLLEHNLLFALWCDHACARRRGDIEF